MTRVKIRCIMGCPGLRNSYREKGLLQFCCLFLRMSRSSLCLKRKLDRAVSKSVPTGDKNYPEYGSM